MTISAVLEWCALNAPVTFAGFGAPGDVAAAERLTGTVWTDDLRALYQQTNGCRGLLPWHEIFTLEELADTRALALELRGYQPPPPYDGPRYSGFTPHELWESGFDEEHISWVGDDGIRVTLIESGLLEVERERQGSIMRDFGSKPKSASPRAPVRKAGSPVGLEFSPRFIPFAGIDGDHLFVDLRTGVKRGCVTAWDNVEAATAGPRWRSLDAMFVDLLAALRSGGEFEGHAPSIVRGELVWEATD